MKRVLSKTIVFVALMIAGASLNGTAHAGGSKPPQGARYPFVYAHGAFASDELFGIPVYYRVQEAFESQGHKFFMPELSSTAPVRIRGEQLLDAVEDVMAITGAPKVNLMGHSFGGLDARYVAHVLGAAKVASVTTFSTPHRGMPSGDLALLVMNGLLGVGDLGEGIVDVLAWLVGGWLINGDPTLPQDGSEAVLHISTAYAAEWNKVVTNVPGIYYESWGGAQPVTNLADPGDYFMAFASVLYGFEPNDGIVGVGTAAWGNVRNLHLKANHLDFSNQLFGLSSWFFDPLQFYKDVAAGLKGRGY